MVYQYKQFFCYRSEGYELFSFSLLDLIEQVKTIYKIDILTQLN